MGGLTRPMHQGLILIARAISFAHDHWRRTIGRRRPLSGRIGVLEERVARLEAENNLLWSRFLRVHRLKVEWPRWGTSQSGS